MISRNGEIKKKFYELKGLEVSLLLCKQHFIHYQT